MRHGQVGRALVGHGKVTHHLFEKESTMSRDLNFGPISSDRERECMSFLATLIGPTGREDGGPGLDTLEGWCERVKARQDQLAAALDAARAKMHGLSAALAGGASTERVRAVLQEGNENAVRVLEECGYQVGRVAELLKQES